MISKVYTGWTKAEVIEKARRFIEKNPDKKLVMAQLINHNLPNCFKSWSISVIELEEDWWE